MIETFIHLACVHDRIFVSH